MSMSDLVKMPMWYVEKLITSRARAHYRAIREGMPPYSEECLARWAAEDESNRKSWDEWMAKANPNYIPVEERSRREREIRENST